MKFSTTILRRIGQSRQRHPVQLNCAFLASFAVKTASLSCPGAANPLICATVVKLLPFCGSTRRCSRFSIIAMNHSTNNSASDEMIEMPSDEVKREQNLSEPAVSSTVTGKRTMRKLPQAKKENLNSESKRPRTNRKNRAVKAGVEQQNVNRRKKEEEQPLSPEIAAQMRRKAALIEAKLEELYPKAPEGFLDHTNAFTLLVAVVLSAQCTDAKVNAVTPALFAAASTPAEMEALGEVRIRELIRQIGLTNSKARYLYGLSTALVAQHGGRVPADMEALERLPGVGHKTASVVAAQAFGIPAFPVDTHIHRLACRWGIGDARSVPRTEAFLKRWFPLPQSWISLHTRIIAFGRAHCPATRHDMDECPVCAFAATDEARAANAASPTKFIAPARHKNPFSIRQDSDGPIGPVGPDQGAPLGPALSNILSSSTQKAATGTTSSKLKLFHKTKPSMKNSENSPAKSETKRGRPARGISKSPPAAAPKKEKKPGRPKGSKAKPKVDESGLRRSVRIKEQQNK